MENRYLTGTAVVHFLFVLFGFWIIWMAHDLPGGGNMMPEFAAWGIILFSVLQIVGEIRTARRAGVPVRAWPPVTVTFLRAVMMLAITVVYFAAMFWVGYFVSTFLFVVAGAKALGVKSWRAIAITVVVLLPCLYGFFIMFLGAHLPKGWLI